MSDIGLLMTGILSPELSIYNRPKILRDRIVAIQVSKNSQLYQLKNDVKITPPEFSELEKPLIPKNAELSLSDQETFKRLKNKLNSNLPSIVNEYKQFPKNVRDSFSTCTHKTKDEVKGKENYQQPLRLSSRKTKLRLQVMKISATSSCNIQNRANNQILIATSSNLTPNLNSKSLPTLRFGNSGISVKVLQRILLSNGYAVRVDGVFGALTETAVKAFQSQSKLAEDGVVGKNTWRELTF
ncbi:peptidoglycan-binding domain-containing protein [Calothrix rhizosoleniae]|uniref:peptidoglycan-binding domain-containing protein n=1 Tax=Calothrix rhizosoleniae TaxID=888997 RepID=UPI001F30B8BE|nr:peptidoglycan-binding domain-containing protein [Calothrix rhizosoleniae]